MNEFEKWQNKRMVKTIGYLSNSGAYNAGEKAGWQGALEWVYKTFDFSLIQIKIIEKELN